MQFCKAIQSVNFRHFRFFNDLYEIPSNKKRASQKSITEAEATTFCIKSLANYLPRSDLQIGEI